MHTEETIPTTATPVIRVGNEERSIYLPPHVTDRQMRDMAELGDYGQAAVAIIAHGGPTGSWGLYWTNGQELHLSDGTTIADGLAQAAQLIKHLGWSNGSRIDWNKITHGNVEEALRQAAQELNFL